MKDFNHNNLNPRHPLVSVIVPTFNRPGMLDCALRSILNQTYRPIEILVINDAGQDVEPIVMAMNVEGNIKYVSHKQNKGLSASRNTGLGLAKGEYIAYLDDDDTYYPMHLETLVTFFLENSHYQAAYTDAYCAHQKKQDGRYLVFRRQLIYSYDFDHNRILYQNIVPILCFMHKRNCINKIGGFDESLMRHEDWDILIRMSLAYEIAHIKKITCEYSYRDDGSSMTSGKTVEFRTSCERIFEKYKSHAKRNPQILKGQAHMRSHLRAKEALELTRDGDVEGGISLLNEILTFDPNNAQTHNFLGQLYTISSDRMLALTHFKKAVELDRFNSNYRNNLENTQRRFHFYPDKL